MRKDLDNVEVQLVPVEEEHLPALRKIRMDPKIHGQFFAWRPISERDQAEWYEDFRDSMDRVGFTVMARRVTAVAPDDRLFRPIGFAQVTDIDHRHGTGQVGGFMVDPAWQSKGIGRAMVDMIAGYCFMTIGLRKLWLMVYEDNERAIGIYKKAGFEVEGCLWKHAFRDGCFRDVLVMSLFRVRAESGC